MEFLLLTDLHFQHGNAFQKELLRHLKVDLAKQRDEGTNPDFIVFSGDLVNNPDDKGTYKDFETYVMRPITEIFGLTENRVIFCPGNHDVSRGAQKAAARVGYDWLRNNSTDHSFVEREAFKDGLRDYTRDISKGFFSFCKNWGNTWGKSLVHVSNFPEKKVSFVALNTAFGCNLEGSTHDRGHLPLSSGKALEAFHEVTSGHLVISLMHHTLSDLDERSARNLAPIIDKYSSIHCFGHVHQARPTNRLSSSGSCMHLQGGALYENDGYYNGYALVRVSEVARHVEARYRSYWVDRHEFDEGTNVSKGGLFYNSEASRLYWEAQVPPPSQEDVCFFLMETQSTICSDLEETIVDRTLTSQFVEPVMVKHVREGDGVDILEKRYALLDILRAREHYVLAAGREYGSTSLLRRITMMFFEEAFNLPRALVPAFIDARRMKSYESALLSLVRGALPDTVDKKLKLQSLHENARLVILIDDFDPGNETHLASMQQLRRSLPNARVICAAKMPVISSEHILPIVGLDQFEFLQIRPLNRGRIRLLVHKWMKPNSPIDEIVEAITSRFRVLSIPVTAPYVAIYLSIVSEDISYNPINASTVIENLVEVVLEKYKPAYRLRNVFDYRDQVDYLSHIAEKMVRRNDYLVEYEMLYSWTREHFDEIGIEQDFGKIIEFFVLNKVFEVTANCVSFRYGIFLSFFIASRMKQDLDFRSFIIQPENISRYVNEIDVYCGLNRGDADTIESISKIYLDYAARLATMLEPLSWTEPLENLRLPLSGDEASSAETITRQLTSQNAPDDERDQTLDKSDEHQDARPLVQRPEVSGILEPWILALRAYTVALKNLDAIKGPLKERHLENILEGWATVLRYTCLLFDTLLSDREIRIGHIKVKLNLPDEIKPKLLRLLFTNIPVLISHFVRKDLGSQKLQAQLKNDSLAKSLTVSFLQIGLYSDLKLPEYIGRLKALRAKANSSELFQEALLAKMRDIYVRFNISELDRASFAELATEVSADIQGLKGAERDLFKGKYLSNLKRSELVSRLRDNSMH